MNREDIIRMAREVGLADSNGVVHAFYQLESFAALVASAEREACAKLCDDLDDDIVDGLAGWQYGEAIRARGNVATNDTSQERVDETTKQQHDAPPQRTWVGLTDEEIDDLSRTMVKGNKSVNWLCQAIEAKLKEKNT